MIGSVWDGAVRRPWDHVCYWTCPAANPSATLNRISIAAGDALNQAKIRGIQVEPVSPRLHGEVEALLSRKKTAQQVAAKKTAEVGPVAKLGWFRNDPEVTKAPPVGSIAPDWDSENAQRQEDIKNKITVYSTLLEMRKRCGIMETNNLKLMELVRQATEVGKFSVWHLFTSSYKLTFFQKIQAAWFYVFYFLTSLIHNTVDAYVVAFIKNVREDLSQEQSITRLKFFKTLLSETDEFLIEDLKATEDFANEKGEGLLWKYRDRAIERHYGCSLPELCKAFSEKWVDGGASENVPILRGLQEIPILKWVIKAFEELVNRFIIRRAMKYVILPEATETAVKKGIEATQPHNLPFALSLTRFLNQRLERLLSKIKSGSNDPTTLNYLPGVSEMLPDTVVSLKRALELDGITTPLQLRQKIQELNEGKKWWDPRRFYDPKIDAAIEQGIVKAGNLLMGTLNETLLSGELSAIFLEVATEPFKESGQDQASLEAAYKNESSNLQTTAAAFFKEVVDRAVADRFNGPNATESQTLAEQSFDAQKTVVGHLLHELGDIAGRMDEKIAASSSGPTPENNIQIEIASFLQTVKVLASRKELQETLENVKGEDQNRIWSLLTPLFDRVEKLLPRITLLQKLQDEYPPHSTVASDFKQMEEVLESVRDHSRHLRNPLLSFLRKIFDEIVRLLGKQVPFKDTMREMIDHVSECSENAVKEQMAIDALHALKPHGGKGLLDQMLDYEKGAHSWGFRPRQCLAAIGEQLKYFPAAKQQELQAIIQDGTHLSRNWERLNTVLQEMHQHHFNAKTAADALFEAAIKQTKGWMQEKHISYNKLKELNHRQMKSEMKSLLKEVHSLTQRAEQTELNMPRSLPSAITGLGRLGFTTAVGTVAGTYFGWPVALGALGGAVGKLFNGVSHSKESGWKSLAKTAAGTAIGAAASNYLPPLAPQLIPHIPSIAPYIPSQLASYDIPGKITSVLNNIHEWTDTAKALTAAFAGWGTIKTVQNTGKDLVNEKVWQIFTKAYKLSLDPRIYKAATTRAMKAMVETT